LIRSLIEVDPQQRLSANEALEHPWFNLDKVSNDTASNGDVGDDTPVFFMVGSQRSGSNWLRTMIDEREDLASPHPPHIMRDILPVIGKFGNLREDANFRTLVDHVCTFVERNQVPWTDKFGEHIKFHRALIYGNAAECCKSFRARRLERGIVEASATQRGCDPPQARRVRLPPVDGEDTNELESGVYLLSILDAIHSFFAQTNGKRMWMCKSMGMSKFHDLLLEFYGKKRLRYVYLVRDPRDVAMSFMKT
jgi:hypothetical protein